MKPGFTLNVTDTGIGLLHRTARGWLDIGHASFDDPDLAAALGYLRSTALGLSPRGLSTKIVIPNSQIRYLQIDAPGPDADSRRRQISAALEGRTPYDVHELVFDWWGGGPVVTVAVVARETLTEAEAFAVEHRFNPVAFVALPEDEGFRAEPWFGPTAFSASILSESDTVERDQDPIQIVAREMPRPDRSIAAAAPPAPPAPTETGPAAKGVTETGPAAETAGPKPKKEPAQLVPAPAPVGEPKPEIAGPAIRPAVAVPEVPAVTLAADQRGALEPERSEAPSPEPAPARPPQFAPRTGDSVPAPNVPVRAAPPEALAPSLASPAPPDRKAALALRSVGPEEAPMAVDVPDDAPEEVPAPVPATAPVLAARIADLDDDLPPALSPSAMMAFASRRPGEASAPRALGSVAAKSLQGERPPALGAAMPRPAGARPAVERPPTARPAPKLGYESPPLPRPTSPRDLPAGSQGSSFSPAQGAGVSAPGTGGSAGATIGRAAAATGKGLRDLGALVTAPGIPGARKKKAPIAGSATSSGQASGVETASSAKAATRPVGKTGNAFGTRPLPQRGKPRYLGLILTGVLLLILALVAAWSSFYIASGRSQDRATPMLSENAAPVAPQAALPPDATDEMLADRQDPAVFAGAEAAIAAPEAAGAEAAIAAPEAVEVNAGAVPQTKAALTEDATAEAVVPEPAPATEVATDAATTVPPVTDVQPEIFLAGMDQPPVSLDPLVLQAPVAVVDGLPADQVPPPPFGLVYQFDAEGRIIPTPDGIVTPEGVFLVAGPPPVVPPVRPKAVEAAAVEAAARAAAPPPVPPGVEAVEAAVAQAIAAAGPGTLPEVTAAETFAADPTLSEARPRLRPVGLTPPTVIEGAAGGQDDTSLAPEIDNRFASLRPEPRPGAVLAAGEAARQASEAASLLAQAGAAVQAKAAASTMAVAVSLRPQARPRDMSRAVEAAVAAAVRAPDPPAARAVQPEEEDEPEVASAAPNIPTRANVAKQATFKNAINLSKINLIGVYGTQSKRYALVRQANGRYKKVAVGDSIDGGRVAAITATEVRYQKGGRMIALAMPKG